jgi:SAM-dependent methyltransferase
MNSVAPVPDTAAIARHYAVECELADRLRHADRDTRRTLYRLVYDELFLRVPDHPQNVRKVDAAKQRAAVGRQMRLLGRYLRPDAVFLEIGAGDCCLSHSVADQVRHVYAVDVSQVISSATQRPPNLTFIVSDGVSIELPAGSVHVAYSNQLLEHLHPDDAVQQLQAIVRALASGGVYICVTPHRFSGPHDVSKHFDSEARGFHLKEYSYKELRALFRAAGFRATWSVHGLKGHFVRLPEWIELGVEAGLGSFPRRTQHRVAACRLMRPFFSSMIIVGEKR